MHLVSSHPRGIGLATWSAALAVLRALVFSSTWIAFCIGGLTWGATLLLGLPFSPTAVSLLLFSTLFLYGLDHQLDARSGGLSDPVARRVVLHPLSTALTVLSGLATAILVVKAPTATRLVFGAYASSGVLYGLPCIPRRGVDGLRWMRLKDIPYSKGFVVSAAITIGTVGVPLSLAGQPVLPAVVCAAAALCFLLVAVNTHLFDVPDMGDDRRAGVRTLASGLGLPSLRWASVFALVLGAVVGLLLPAEHRVAGVAFVAGLAASAVFACAVRESTPRLMYGTVLEAIMALPALLLLIHAPLSA